MTEPRAVRAIQFMQDLVQVYKVSPIETGTYELGRAGMSFAHRWVILTLHNGGTLPAGTHYAPFPKGPDANKYVSHVAGAYFLMIPATAPDHCAAAKVAQQMCYYWDPSWLQNMSIDDFLLKELEDYVFSENDLEVLKYLQANLLNVNRVYFPMVNNRFQMVINDVKSSNIPIISVVDKYLQEMRSHIDQVLNIGK